MLYIVSEMLDKCEKMQNKVPLRHWYVQILV